VTLAVAALAERRPDLVLWRATTWLTDDDVDILLRLPHHWHRVALAGALRPWSPASIDRAERGLADEGGADVIARVMADRYPELTRPSGVAERPDRRWHAIGGEVWSWALWRANDGAHALEVVATHGPADFQVGELVDETLVESWRRDGPAALEDHLERLRRSR
jgi:hypothetical protein